MAIRGKKPTKAQVAAAKRRSASKKKAPKKKAPKKKAPAKKAPPKKSAATTAKLDTHKTWWKPGTTTTPKPLAPPTPVGMPDGSIVDPKQWQSDQARLAAAEDDNAEYDSILTEERNASLDEQAEVAGSESRRASARLAAERRLKEYQPVKVDRKKNLDNALSYRGMGRSSAYKRQNMRLKNEDTEVETAITAEQTEAEKEHTAAIGSAAHRRKSRLAAVAPRKNLLAKRGARAGVYTR
jgi:hypothetical protein